MAVTAGAALGQVSLNESEHGDGLVATYADESGNVARRIDRSVSFSWGQHVPDPRLTDTRFSVNWRGQLAPRVTGVHHFYLFVHGKARLTIDDHPLIDVSSDSSSWYSSKPFELPPGTHSIEIEFESLPGGATVRLFWSGPQFQLEPVPARVLFHQSDDTEFTAWSRGEELVRALRCAACHQLGRESVYAPGPSLDHLSENIIVSWLTNYLAGSERTRVGSSDSRHVQRMPSFGFSETEAESLTAYLTSFNPTSAEGVNLRVPRTPTKGDPRSGRDLLMTIGCLACHQMDGVGSAGLFGGGDLSRIAEKRPADFFLRWLRDPDSVNSEHRMPTFELTKRQRLDLAAYLASLGDPKLGATSADEPSQAVIQQGARLYHRGGCVNCHALARAEQQGSARFGRLTKQSNWNRSCAGKPDGSIPRPGYHLPNDDQRVIRQYIISLPESNQSTPSSPQDHWAVKEHNCLECHARGNSQGIATTVQKLVETHTELNPVRAALVPPSLNGVGDKLRESALTDAITGSSTVRRPWLKIRMPKFNLDDSDVRRLADFFVRSDRIPERDKPTTSDDSTNSDRFAGTRLVTSDGFGCTSCHQIGNVKPPQAPLNQRAPDLTMLRRRIRRPWYDRWVRNPARIVPRMEMPAVQVPVLGILNDDLDRQLAAVWSTLNQPDFEPPLPNPVRVVRRSGSTDAESAVVITDVVRSADSVFVKPLLIGLPTRHNLLFNLQSSRLSQWWIGDVARQRTEGKTWYWEAGGPNLFDSESSLSEVFLIRDGTRLEPVKNGQFVTEADQWKHTAQGIVFHHRLHFSGRDNPQTNGRTTIRVRQSFTVDGRRGSVQKSTFRRTIAIQGVPSTDRAGIRVAPGSNYAEPNNSTNRELLVNGRVPIRITIAEPSHARFDASGNIIFPSTDPDESLLVDLTYATDVMADEFPVHEHDFPSPPLVQLDTVPGFAATRLPLENDIMPIAMDWNTRGKLFVGSLKGRVWSAVDTDGDELEDRLRPFSDELAAPYGLAAHEAYVDVATKYSILRLIDEDKDGQADIHETVASGWGHTDDYHDWTVGMPQDESGNYYVATACQQDDRSLAAARMRGKVLKLIPRQPTRWNPLRYRIEEVSGGHRFPMGIARNGRGELFVTDNQGNYNPFNELNHVLPGRRYGFINELERNAGFQPVLTPPAINIPHPWTRSVNGICFLETPPAVAKTGKERLFGPFEGHLIGCEYDTRRVVRMSLQRVGETIQGAVYPLSVAGTDVTSSFLGPICCAVAPDGDVYIGSIRDSGWGGANNIGSIAVMRFRRSSLPTGIGEVRLVPTGFEIDFTGPVDATRATRGESYSISSYTRDSTPAYGGPDRDRRVETIEKVSLSADRQTARLSLNEIRTGFVYEIRIANIASDGEAVFPSEAFYTVNRRIGTRPLSATHESRDAAH